MRQKEKAQKLNAPDWTLGKEALQNDLKRAIKTEEEKIMWIKAGNIWTLFSEETLMNLKMKLGSFKSYNSKKNFICLENLLPLS